MGDNSEGQKDPKYPTVISATTGALAGATAASAPAISAAGAGGLAGYFAGIGALAAHIGCETVAVVGLGTVAAGPVIGGLIGYGIFRGVKKVVRG